MPARRHTQRAVVSWCGVVWCVHAAPLHLSWLHLPAVAAAIYAASLSCCVITNALAAARPCTPHTHYGGCVPIFTLGGSCTEHRAAI